MKIDLPDPCVCASCGDSSPLEDVLSGKSGHHFYLMWFCTKCKQRFDAELEEEMKSFPF